MAKSKQSKQASLATLGDKLKRSKSLIFTHYQGLTVKDVTTLRNLMRQQDAEFMVVKKTLLAKALAEAKIGTDLTDRLSGDVALAFGYNDQVAPAKILQTFSKAHPSIALMGGIVDGVFIEAGQAVALAKLPSREELIARTVGTLKGPLTGLVQVLNGSMRGLINVLQAYKDTKPAVATE